MSQKKDKSGKEISQGTPAEMEFRYEFRIFMKILSSLWTVCLIAIIIVPLFDFPGNQLITTISYLYVFVGLIVLFMFEFFQQKLYSLFSTVYRLFQSKR